MENQTAQKTSRVSFSNESKSVFSNVFFVAILTLLLGVLIGIVLLGFVFRPKISPKLQEATLTTPSLLPQESFSESELPVSLSLLNNPIIYEWRGSVKGELVQKEDHSFVLEDGEGNSVTITDIMPSGDIFKTVFLDKNNQNQPTTLEEIPLGSVLLGDFFIFRNGPDSLVGSMFIKQ